MKNHYRRVRERDVLHPAWSHVKDNGLTSKSNETRNAVKAFAETAPTGLDRIARQLLKKNFVFKPVKGKPQKRKGKKPRPIVVAPIESRIVQRAILTVLQEDKSIQTYLNVPTSFGGIPRLDDSSRSRWGVAGAIEYAIREITAGNIHFVRSDIADFFPMISKDVVVTQVKEHISDEDFIELFELATDVELENMTKLGVLADLYPIYEVGVAQGCCLSPLIGNIFLFEFDSMMNEGPCVCLRYIDDILILGPSQEEVAAAFSAAHKYLKGYGMKLYSPRGGTKKASMGVIREGGNGLDYLGCYILHRIVKPNRQAIRRIQDKVDELFSKSEQEFSKVGGPDWNPRYSFVRTVEEARKVLKGWGDHYQFSNDDNTFANVDRWVDKRYRTYKKRFDKAQSNSDDNNKRRLLGLHLVEDRISSPILWE